MHTMEEIATMGADEWLATRMAGTDAIHRTGEAQRRQGGFKPEDPPAVV